MVTEPELVERSLRLETSIANSNMPEFCDSKIGTSVSADDQQVWRFVKANFGDSPRLDFLDLLGYNPDEMSKKVGRTDIRNADPLWKIIDVSGR